MRVDNVEIGGIFSVAEMLSLSIKFVLYVFGSLKISLDVTEILTTLQDLITRQRTIIFFV